MKAQDIYHRMKAIAEDYHAYTDQLTAIAKWIESEFDYNPNQNKVRSGMYCEMPKIEIGKFTIADMSNEKECTSVWIENTQAGDGGEFAKEKLKTSGTMISANIVIIEKPL